VVKAVVRGLEGRCRVHHAVITLGSFIRLSKLHSFSLAASLKVERMERAGRRRGRGGHFTLALL
jgi:hypothetical protein